MSEEGDETKETETEEEEEDKKVEKPTPPTLNVTTNKHPAVKRYYQKTCFTFVIAFLILFMALGVMLNNKIFDSLFPTDPEYLELHHKIQHIKKENPYELLTDIKGMSEKVFPRNNGTLYCTFNMTGIYNDSSGWPVFQFPFPNHTEISNYCLKRFDVAQLSAIPPPSYYTLNIGKIFCMCNIEKIQGDFKGYWIKDQCWLEGKRGGVYMNSDSFYSHLIRQTGAKWASWIPKNADIRTLPLDWSDWVLDKIQTTTKRWIN